MQPIRSTKHKYIISSKSLPRVKIVKVILRQVNIPVL